MALEDAMSSLREFNLGDLDFDNVGSWPLAIKALVLASVAYCSFGGRLLLPY